MRAQGILSNIERFQLTSGQDFELSPAEVQKISEQLDIPSSVLKKIGQNAARTNLIASHVANIDAVIVGRPTTSVVLYSQMIGRGLRGEAMGGTKNCKIVDVVDNILNMPASDEAFTFFDKFYR